MNELEAANARLKASRARCSIQCRGGTYALVATLPARDGGAKKQQRISLGQTTVLEAERRALELSVQLRSDTFTWDAWDAPAAPTVLTFDAFRAAAEKLHATRYRKDPERGRHNWTKNWAPALRKLPSAGAVTEQSLLRFVESLPEQSSSRRNQGCVIAQVADSVGIPTKAIRKAAAGYGSAQLAPRDIPEDGVIEAFILSTPLPHWHWSLGMLATYGLRPHELERIVPGPDKTWIVDDHTKTGTRQVHPCPSTWYDLFELGHERHPRTSNQEMSRRISKHLRDRSAPFTAYSLRHAYAIRLMEKGVPPELGCRLMGHSLQTHETQYKRWLQQERINRAMVRYDL